MKTKSFLLLVILAIFFAACTKNSPTDLNIIHGVLESNVKGIDPIIASDTYSNRIVSQIYEGLYNYHYLKRPLDIQPLLADGLPEISPDGLTYTIKIKKGVYFADDSAFENSKGREVTADDFIYSWKRLVDVKNNSTGFWIFDGRIKGLNEWREKARKGQASYQTPVEGLKAIDSHTLVIQLTKPFYQFIHLLTMPFTMVVPKEAVDVYGEDFVNKPVGTGPFKLKQWVRGSFVRLIRNDNYHEVLYPSEGEATDAAQGLLKDAGKRLPLIDEVEIKIMSERQPMWLSFQKGELDHLTVVPKDNFDDAFENGELKKQFVDKGMRFVHFARPDVIYVNFNMENPQFGKNKNLRLGLAKALDRKTLLRQFYNGRGVLANGPIPPSIDGYDPNYHAPVDFNLEEAKKLIKEAGFPEGKGLPTFNYDLASDATVGRQIGEFFKENWAKIGVKIKLINNTWPQFDKKVKQKKSELFSMSWAADYPDAENFLQMYYGKNVSPGSNSSNFRNSVYDAMYDKASVLPPGPERTELYRQMNKFVAEEVPSIFTFHRVAYLPYQGWLQNFKQHIVIQDFYKYLSVDKDAKRKLKAKL